MEGNGNGTVRIIEGVDLMQNLLKQIEYNNGIFPRKILEEIIQRKDEAIPQLLEIMKEVRDNPEKYIEDGDYFGHIYAVHLLAQFRVKELYPIFIDILKLPDEMPHNLFGDLICESAGRILATVCFDNIKPIKDLIEDENIDEYVRGQAIHALAVLALHSNLKREDVLGYYRELLNGGIKDNNHSVMAGIVCNCDDLYPKEIYDDIKRAYEQGLVDYGIINIDDVDYTLSHSKNEVLERSKNDIHLQFIDNTITELEHWACFHKDYEARMQQRLVQSTVKKTKIGRNEPCPCGSGKKYKKCCIDR